MKFPNPNLLRFIRPTWLQLWCAQHGVLSGRWTSAEVEAIRRRATRRYHKLRKLLDDYDPYDYAEFACHLCGHELIAPWELCPGCGANLTDKDSPNAPKGDE